MVVLALAGLLTQGGEPFPVEASVTSSTDFYSLPPEVARRGRPVRIEGVSLYGDPGWRMLFLQDAKGRLYVGLPETGTWPAVEAGNRVVVEGKTCLTNGERSFADLSVKLLGPGQMPRAVPLDAAAMLSPERGAAYVEVRGLVRNISEEDRLRLLLQIDGRRTDAWVRQYLPADMKGLLDAEVRLRGVNAHKYNEKGEIVGAVLYINTFKDVQIEKPGPADPFLATVTPIKRLFALPPDAKGQPQRVRIQGTVVQQTLGQSLVVSDETESIVCLSSQPIRLDKDQRVDVIGFPQHKLNARVLEDALFRVVDGAQPALLTLATNAEAGRDLALLEQAQDIHRLKPQEARLRYPVKLRGVVTYFDASWRNLFVHDASGGVYVDPGGLDLELKAGQRVEVIGRTDPGGYKPMVIEPQVRLLGEGEFPVPTPLSFERGRSGVYDCQWVEFQGVVQSAEMRDDHFFFGVSSGDGSVRCWLPSKGEPAFAANLLGATVRVQGVCGVRLTAARMFAGLGINVPDATKVQVVARPPQDPFNLETLPVKEVVRTLPAQMGGGLVKVGGQITLQRPGLGLFLQDGTAGIYVQSSQTDHLALGDEVEVVGFPSLGESAPILRRARFRRVRPSREPAPNGLTAERILRGQGNAELVRLEGRVLESVTASTAPELILQDGQAVFSASVESSMSALALPPLEAGSRVQLTGVCVIKAGEWGQPKSFRLLLRSPKDVVVTKGPPFLNFRRVLGFTAALGIVTLAALGWVAALGRRVRIQTEHIRQRLEREAALEARYRELVENAKDIIFSHDLTGRFLAINKAGARLLGFGPEEALQMNLLTLVVPEHRDRVGKFLERGESGERMGGYEVDVLTKDGRRITLEASTRVLQSGGEITGVESIARDITERRNLEMQLRQAQKMESIGQLAAGVAHDFNNLLTVIQGHASLLQAEGNSPQRGGESAAEIASAAQRAAELTRQLLAFGRKQVMCPQVLDPNQALTGVAKMLQRLLGEHIALDLSCEPGLPSIRVDLGMMEQVIVNLAVNARDAMPKGGRLKLRTRRVSLDAQQARQYREAQAGEYVGLYVEDNGCGMSPATRARLFEPFFTTKEVGKGTGLGLATAYGIVRQHGGWINVASDLGQGTSFEVLLPVDGAPVPGKEPRAPDKSQQRLNRSVLIVEDELAVRNLASRILQRNGYRALEATSGKEALRVWAEHSETIDLLFTDMVMPEGVSGRVLAERLRAQRPSLPVIYASGYSAELAGEGMRLQEGVNFLQKPYAPSDLVRIVAKCFGAS